MKFRAFLNHPAGPKTVHFWAPLCKWGLVLAGLKEVKRPPHLISTSQSIALTTTGFIWARYCYVIIPRNYFLMSVNFFVGIVGGYQLVRKFRDDEKGRTPLPSSHGQSD